MFRLSAIIALVRKDLMIELKQIYGAFSILLYALIAVYLTSMVTQELEVKVWNAIFWVLILFSAVQSVLKSFSLQESKQKILYYTLVHPLEILIAKVIYNTFLLAIIGALILASFFLFIPDLEVKFLPMLFLVFIASIGLSVILSFASVLSSHSSNSSLMVSILGFPLCIPMFLELNILAIGSIKNGNLELSNLGVIFGLIILIFGLALLLFPWIWRD